MASESASRPGGPAGRIWTVLFVASAAPGAVAVEVLARTLLFPAELLAFRADLEGALTSVAWGLCALTLPAVALGLWAQQSLVRRGLARLGEITAERSARVELEALLLASSIPQVPALLGAVAAMGGAAAAPVLATVAISTAGVVAMGVRRVAAPRPSPPGP